MRTTLSIDDEVLELVKRYAADRAMPVGEAVSELIRKAFRTPTPTKMVNGYACSTFLRIRRASRPGRLNN